MSAPVYAVGRLEPSGRWALLTTWSDHRADAEQALAEFRRSRKPAERATIHLVQIRRVQ